MNRRMSRATSMDRRRFLQGAGSLVAAGAALLPRLGHRTADAQGAPDADLPYRPNILLIITDQERRPQWWPEGWADTNLPNRKRLKDNGLVFQRAYCNSAMCTPSRATLFTGVYPQQHGAKHTLSFGGTASDNQPTMPLNMQNMAKMLASAGYDVHFRGKWHLSKAADGGEPSADDVAAYGFQGWSPPDAGQDIDPANFGSGCVDHDSRFAAQAADFLRMQAPTQNRPFALIVSFANPHDVLAYPRSWNSQSEEDPTCYNYRDEAPDCFNQGISLPPTFNEEIDDNYKPTAHGQLRTFLAAGLGPLVGPADPERYVNFYAYLQRLVDEEIGVVLDTLEDDPDLHSNTLVIHTSDHGEVGLSHGGLRQKAFNVYEETVNVPLVISNPHLFPERVETTALASLIDLMPTLATLADIPDRTEWTFQGRDLTPVLADALKNPDNPSVTVQDSVYFTFDDENMGAPNGQNVITAPNFIRCLVENRWKFAYYFDPAGAAEPQFELYDRLDDPEERHNMANPANAAYYDEDMAGKMWDKLVQRMSETGTLPYSLRLPLIIGSRS